MHALMNDNPIHFPDDILPENERYRLHTPENWYRALRVITFFKENVKFFTVTGHKTNPAVKPLFFNVRAPGNAQIGDEMVKNTSVANEEENEEVIPETRENSLASDHDGIANGADDEMKDSENESAGSNVEDEGRDL